MKIEDVPFCRVDWQSLEPAVHNGISGEAYWRTFEQGNVRARLVEYTPGYLADHWCKRGHVMFVLEGELNTELDDGRIFTMRAGSGYVVADDINPHRSSTPTGVKLFIVD